MAVLLIYPVLAIAMLTFEYMVCRGNYNVIWNGMGAIDSVVDRTNPGPQRQRILVPWLVRGTEWWLGWPDDPPERLPIYLFWKWVLMSAAMMVAGHYFSPVIALGMALYWMFTVQYDYWSVYAEALAFLLVLTGDVWLACLGAIVGAASKSTAIVLPLVFLSIDGSPHAWHSAIVFLITGLSFAVVYRRQGPTKTIKRKPMNVAPHYIFKRDKKKAPYYLMGWGVIVVSVVAFWLSGSMPEPFRSTAWVPVAICAAGFLNALVYEPRVFAVNAIWIVSLLL